MALDFIDSRILNQRALHHAVLEAVADLEQLDFGGEFLHELLVDAFLHINAVGADAGLAGIAVFARHRAFDGRVDVGIVEHDKGCIAAEFERQFLDRRRALRHQNAADFGRAGKADVAHHVAGAKHLADGD